MGWVDVGTFIAIVTTLVTVIGGVVKLLLEQRDLRAAVEDLAEDKVERTECVATRSELRHEMRVGFVTLNANLKAIARDGVPVANPHGPRLLELPFRVEGFELKVGGNGANGEVGERAGPEEGAT
jgi:hypothetical protein